MYMILKWLDEDSEVVAIENKNGSIKLFETLIEADEYANAQEEAETLRVISIEGVK